MKPGGFAAGGSRNVNGLFNVLSSSAKTSRHRQDAQDFSGLPEGAVGKGCSFILKNPVHPVYTRFILPANLRDLDLINRAGTRMIALPKNV